jgi:hypothetical protein
MTDPSTKLPNWKEFVQPPELVEVYNKINNEFFNENKWGTVQKILLEIQAGAVLGGR